MWKYTFAVIATVVYANSQQVKLTSGEDLVSTVLNRCVDINCVKQNVLRYLDNLLNIQSDVRNLKSVDAVIFERLGKILKTHEIRFKLPESLVQHTDIVYNPRFGLDVISPLLLMPLFVAIIGIKAAKALILSKLAIVIVIGFLIYQILGKAGMPMPLSMTATATDSPSSMYGVPAHPLPHQVHMNLDGNLLKEAHIREYGQPTVTILRVYRTQLISHQFPLPQLFDLEN
ncbi:hypothetical protein NQ317_001144 [Molorchus minor]|uniref:Osiris 18 n=1 Tax=Molorchus minor TaxID=1323400 RepID=A0ABQ9IWK4_9CUCU|nr:hypothetical protein NQ317_001144 [Molorchus minor]